ncbi:MAG: tRNA uridine-5-carboxymethylaminomethyl(34) synthesis GTPase MnmE [Bacteroidota bacterium]
MEPSKSIFNEIIIAPATASGVGAIAVIRISGHGCFEITNNFFEGKNGKKNLLNKKTHTISFGTLKHENKIIDEVLISKFISPNSYTGEDTLEISCHGSLYIQSKIVQLFCANGCRLANPGEFTLRAFLNGKLDLSQAEAVADVIAAESESVHNLAFSQLRGGFATELKNLRNELINFASLIELELDFAEEDVSFAKREDLTDLVNKLLKLVIALKNSFSLGNTIKNGIAVAIAGRPNVGKSTLLNALLKEERAIVSEIAGTTRDSIEDVLNIKGYIFRFIDTAGIRETNDAIEKIGISKTFEKIKEAKVVLYICSAAEIEDLNFDEIFSGTEFIGKKIIVIVNKIDLVSELKPLEHRFKEMDIESLFISAKSGENLHLIEEKLLSLTVNRSIENNDLIVSNSRHYEALIHAEIALEKTLEGIESNITGDFLAQDIRTSLYHIGQITGQIEIDRDILGTIFSKFCIGK